MALRQPLEGAAQVGHVERRPAARGADDVVRRAFRLLAPQKPERPLTVGQRAPERALLAGGPRPGRLGDPGPRGQIGDRGAQKVGHREDHAESSLDLVQHLDGRQGVEPVARDRLAGAERTRRDAKLPCQERGQPGGRVRGGIPRLFAHAPRRLRQAAGLGAPLLDRLEGAVQELLPAGLPLHLPAGGPRQRARRDQQGGPHLHLVLRGDRLSDSVQHHPPLGGPAGLDLVHHYQPFLPLGHHREGAAASGAKRGVLPLHGQLDVLRVVVDAADDDQILQAAGDVELAPQKESEVSRPQPAALAGARDPAPEGVPGLLLQPPVAERDVVAADPDLPHLSGCAAPRPLRLHDRHLFVEDGRAATDEIASLLGPGERLHHPMHLERPGVDGLHAGRAPAPRAGDDQRRLGQPVAGEERLAAETRPREGGGEPPESVAAHGLGAVESHLPGTEVELGPLLGGAPLHAQLIGEVGSTAGVGPVA